MPKPKRLKHKCYGLRVYEIDGKEYAFAPNEEKADKAARVYCYESLWAFRTEWIVEFMARQRKKPMSERERDTLVKAIKIVQEKLCEDANEIVRVLLRPNVRAFAQQSIEADGRGHFLASYDGCETASDEFEGLPPGGFVYRIN